MFVHSLGIGSKKHIFLFFKTPTLIPYEFGEEKTITYTKIAKRKLLVVISREGRDCYVCPRNMNDVHRNERQRV